MRMKKNRRWINILILCIALLLLVSGTVMLMRVFSHYGEVLLEQQDGQLTSSFEPVQFVYQKREVK